MSHRVLMCASIAAGESTIQHLLMGEDCLATLRILQSLGVQIVQDDKTHCWHVFGVGLHGLQPSNAPLFCGNSGTSMRLLAGLLAGQSFSSTLTGDAYLTRRPMARVADPLRRMGARITLSSAATAPLTIHPCKQLLGQSHEQSIQSAQVKSAILLAGLYAGGDTVYHESVATRDHTERLLQAMQYPVTVSNGKVSLRGGGQLQPGEFHIPADISSAAFFMVAATLVPGSDLTLLEVGVNPTRRAVIDLLNLMGANIQLTPLGDWQGEPVADIRIQSAPLVGVDIPVASVPNAIDELPIVLLAAACARGVTRLRGAAELRHKESDRLAAMSDLLSCLGVQHELLLDGMTVQGGTLRGGRVKSMGDHRIAMTGLIAGACADAPVTVDDCDNIDTSFPGFVKQANLIGLNVAPIIA